MNILSGLCNVAGCTSYVGGVLRALLSLYVIVWLSVSAENAAAAPVEKTMTIVGTIYAAIPCVINDNQPILGKFDDIITTKIDGSYRTITLGYTMDCKRAKWSELRLKVQGTPASFDSSALAVPSRGGLGIALKADSRKLAVNTWYNFSRDSKPLLQAVLVKSPGSVIDGGAFSSSATLMVDYQ